ncbi:MAG: FAD-dependent monooxygenase, partial [Planktomarina sp.]|nr:FAD-dependent monooxygenase [Planktomarina sp.]
MSLKAIIIGGGIGGLSVAICLRLIGWQVRVLEQAPKISEVGAGVQISPNGVKILEKMGVMSLLESSLFEPDAIEILMGVSGGKLLHLPMKDAAVHRWGARYIQIHRADLIAGLTARLAKLAPDTVQVGAQAASYTHHTHGVRVVLKDGTIEHADLAVGADGIHSTIRNQMLGPDTPHFTGNIAWRALVPLAQLGDLAPPATGCIWVGYGKHAVTTRIKAGATVNFIGVVEQSNWKKEGWKTEGRKQDALADFAGWDKRILNVIQNARVLHKWALFDRPPLPHWHDKHVVLLGDAAHPMLPSMAQGAVQSIEDAYILTQCLKEAKDDGIPRAIANYFDERIERVTKVQRVSAQNLRLFHKSSLPAQILSYGPIWLAGKLAPSLVQKRNDWLYGKVFGNLTSPN